MNAVVSNRDVSDVTREDGRVNGEVDGSWFPTGEKAGEEATRRDRLLQVEVLMWHLSRQASLQRSGVSLQRSGCLVSAATRGS